MTVNPRLPAAAAAIVRRCLEKNKEERFQSARDLAFALQQLRDSTTSTSPLPAAVGGPPPDARARLFAALLVAAVARRSPSCWRGHDSAPVFEQLTFHRGRIGGARFASDGAAVVYSEAREGNRLDVWRIHLADSPSSGR